LRHLLVLRLADGEWHALRALALEYGDVIPPEIAIRRGAAQRFSQKRDLSIRIRQGRSFMVRRTLERMGAESDNAQNVQERRYRLTREIVQKRRVLKQLLQWYDPKCPLLD
jgi:hypothetical protein